MAPLCARYPSISPWNIRDLTWGDYLELVRFAVESVKEQQKPERGRESGG